MRSSSISPREDGTLIRIASLSSAERERLARVERARLIGELVADAILWVARLPRRLGGLVWHPTPGRRV